MADADVLYIVDGSGFIFRAYHALPPLTTRAGIPAGAVFGFTGMLMKLDFEKRPSHLVVVFDASVSSFRHSIFPAYKANRAAPPEDLAPQFGMVRRVVDAFGIPRIEAVGVEADDVIAALVRQARIENMAVKIVSSDKDLMQLVDEPACVLWDTMKDKTYDSDAVREKFGVGPRELGDVLALMGDSVDNIPGIRGVGPKTASAIIQYFGSLDEAFRRIDEVEKIPGLRGAKSVAEKLRAHEADARLSRQLVSLDDTVPLPRSLESLVRVEPDLDQVEKALTDLDFTRLLDRLRGLRGDRSATERRAQLPVPVMPVVPVLEPVVMHAGPTRILTDATALAEYVAAHVAGTALGLSIETAAPSPIGAALVGVGLFSASSGPAYLPVSHRYLGVPKQLPWATAMELLAPLFGKDTPKHLADAKDGLLAIRRAGGTLDGIRLDPLIAAYLLDAPTTLPELATSRLGVVLTSRAALVGTGKRALHIDEIEVERVGHAAAGAAEAALHLGSRLGTEIEALGMTRLLEDVEMPLMRVLAAIEPHGVVLDVDVLREIGGRVETRMAELEAAVRLVSGREVNLGSPKQLQELLFDKLGLNPTKKTKTGYSVDAEVLEELALQHPVAAQIAEHRTLAKLKGTYIDALPLLVDSKTGRLHTSYKQTVAATGRLSSVEPNLQNVPIRTPLGKEIRRAFRAAPGNVLVVGDYSQIELRILAHLSGDAVLTDAFIKDQDIHHRTAIEMFGPERGTESHFRSVAKMINYGIVYGLSDYGLSQRLGIERGDARRYIDGYLATYRGVASYMERVVDEAHRAGGARTLLGRFRPLPELAARNRQVRMAGERMARNTPVQGTAADLLKLAMIRVEDELLAFDGRARMLLTVHDELVLEAPVELAPAVSERLRRAMEDVWALSVPLKVDLGMGPSWAEAK